MTAGRWLLCLLLLASCGSPEETIRLHDPDPSIDGNRSIIVVRNDDDGESKSLESIVFDLDDPETDDLRTAIAWACETEIRQDGFDTSFVNSCTNPVWLDDPTVNLTASNWRKNAIRASCEAGHLMSIATAVAPLYIYYDDDNGSGTLDHDEDTYVSPISPDSSELPDFLVGLKNPVTVPPQLPKHQGTAALLAFQKLQSAVAWTGLVLNPSVCTDTDLSVPANLRRRLVATLAESVVNLEEASNVVNDRLMTTAEARRSEEHDFSRANILRWRATTDSRLDAARVAMLIPDRFFERNHAEGVFPVVTAAPESVAQQRAYDLLRRAEVNPSLRGDELLDALRAALNADYPSPNGDAFETNDDVLLAFSISPQDLNRAVIRHTQELQVLGLASLPDPRITEGPARYLNLQRSERHIPWAYHYARLEGSMELGHPTGDGLTTEYARRGLAHALDFAHYVVHRIRDRDLGPANEVVDTTWAWLDAQVHDRARVCHVGERTDNWRFHVTFHDAPTVADADEGADRYRAFRTEAGLECAMTGHIGRAPCNPSDWEVPRSTTLLAGGAYNDHGQRRALVELTNAKDLVGERVYFTWDRDPLGQSRTLLLGIEVQAPPSEVRPIDDWVLTDDEANPRDPNFGYAFDDGRDEGRGGSYTTGPDDEGRTRGGGYEGTPPSNLSCHFVPIGPALENTLAVLNADPSDPSESQISCAGVPADIRIKLEDELTEMFTGRDNIESSTATSLTTARASADEAERLGDDLFNAQLNFDEYQSNLELRELALDERMNDVAGQLTALCGGYIDPIRLIEAACEDPDAECDLAGFIATALSNPDAFDALDLREETASDLWGLRACLGLGATAVDWVAVGRRDLCAFKPEGFPVCTCLQDECPPCPVAIEGTATASSCTAALGLDEVVEHWGSCSGGTGVETECESGVTTLGDLYAPYPIKTRLNLGGAVSDALASATCEEVVDSSFTSVDHAVAGLHCLAAGYSEQVDHLYIADVPLDVADDLRSGLASDVYPTHRGNYGAAIAAMGGDLLNVRQLSEGVAAHLTQAASSIQILEIKLDGYELQDELAELSYNELLAVNAAECVASFAVAAATAIQGREAFAAAAEAASVCIIGSIKAGFAATRRSLEEALSTNVQAHAIQETIHEILARMDSLEAAVISLQQAFARLNQHMAEVDGVRTSARQLINQLGLLEQQRRQPDAVINRAYSYRIQRLQYQYDEALRRAKRDTLLALRTIEQRIGMRLDLMNQDMALGVPAPQTWVHRICSTSGLDYDQLRDSSDAVPEGYDPADGHIGEMVSLLEDFIQAYRHDFPFQDHEDTMVVSLREDVLGLVDWCEGAQPNLLLGTGQLDVGWTSGCDELLCAEVVGTLPPAFSFPGSSAATTVSVATLGLATSVGATGSSIPAVEQQVSLDAGTYTFSWYGPDANPLSAIVLDAATGAPVPLTIAETCPPEFSGVWGRCQLVFELASAADVIVGFQPSGPAQVLAPQLEEGFGASVEFFATDDDLTAPYLCSTDGLGGNLVAAMSEGIEYYCPDGTGVDCATRGAIDPEALPQRRYLSATFPLDLNMIEAGAIMSRTGFAIGNFNYRHQRIGLWVDAGPDATFCPEGDPGLSGGCLADAHVNWSLFHTGPFATRNHLNDRAESRVFPGVIRQARGGISSGPLSDPFAATDGTVRSVVEELMVDFQGRPFEGQVEVRIYDDEHLNLDAIRDVQLVVDYSYWTRSTP
ncbi:MAG: hypothetical protein AAGE52_06600 [Myxococcota bacterium]